MLRLFCYVLIFFCLTPQVDAQVKSNKIKASAEEYFNNQKYAEALNLYSKYQRLAPDDVSIIAPIGICQYHLSQMTAAVKNLQIVVVNTKKPELDHLYYYALAQHAVGEFERAGKTYKQFLKLADGNDSRRSMVKDFLSRCGTGLRIQGYEELAVVDNLGESVNTIYDEFAPVLSPNYSNKLYLSSSRVNSIGGLRDEDGKKDDQFGNFKADMYSTYENNGQWGIPEPLPGLLNSAKHDLIMDFVENGQVVLFFKTNDLVSGEILIDTFGRDDQKLFPESFSGPLDQSIGDCSLYFFNDTTLFFSSRRAGGYGGLDLYLSRYTNGRWTNPKNLGPAINSNYDETQPFVAKDGRTIYFSSNRLQSMGGLDIFSSRYFDQKEAWTAPANLGPPINSPGDDGYFRLANDGLKAYFASERNGGFGGQDIYLAYFKQKRNEHLVSSRPELFDEVPAYRRQMRESGDFVSRPLDNATVSADPNISSPTITKYIFRPLYVGSNDQVQSPGNIQMMDKMLELMKANPQVKLQLTGHGDGKSPTDFELYFSIKRAEKVAEYLTTQGISSNRILVRGVGVQYPYLRIQKESGPQINVDKFNRRIEYKFIGLEGSGIAIEMEEQKLRDNLKDPAAQKLIELEKGLYYRIQVVAVNQNFSGISALQNNDWIVERHRDGSYRYMAGRTNTYKEAQKLNAELIQTGQYGAFVVPYLNGIRLKRSEILQLAGQYPDLQFYLGSDD